MRRLFPRLRSSRDGQSSSKSPNANVAASGSLWIMGRPILAAVQVAASVLLTSSAPDASVPRQSLHDAKADRDHRLARRRLDGRLDLHLAVADTADEGGKDALEIRFAGRSGHFVG